MQVISEDVCLLFINQMQVPFSCRSLWSVCYCMWIIVISAGVCLISNIECGFPSPASRFEHCGRVLALKYWMQVISVGVFLLWNFGCRWPVWVCACAGFSNAGALLLQVVVNIFQMLDKNDSMQVYSSCRPLWAVCTCTWTGIFDAGVWYRCPHPKTPAHCTYAKHS